MSKEFIKYIAVFLLLLGISACQTTQYGSESHAPLEPPLSGQWYNDLAPFKSQLAEHKQRSNWQYRAKVGVITPDLREQVNLVWQFDEQLNRIKLFGPLGVGAVKLEFDQNGATLHDNKGRVYQGRTADAVLEQVTGWPIPVDALGYWLFALPMPDRRFEYQLNNTSQISHLKQLGWEIRYSDYRDYAIANPSESIEPATQTWQARKITAIKRVSPTQQVTVKLITKAWQ